MILLLVYSPFQALRISRLETEGGARARLRFLPSFLLFPLVQCFYIRSYIGISNTASLLMLIMVMSISVRLAFDVAAQAPADVAPPSRTASRSVATNPARAATGDIPRRT